MTALLVFIWRAILFLWDWALLWFPIVGGIVTWQLWVRYAQEKFDSENKKTLLEIKVPRELLKSPLAMEVVLAALNMTSREATFIDRNIKGKSRPKFSLEIVSLGGEIHFFIWTEAGFKNLIEAQIYAQYPEVEVHEVPDYAKAFHYEPGKNDFWACEFVKEKPSPYPIKTYVDYGLDKDPKEEFKTDPITPMLETFGSIKEGEQMWFQMIVKAHKKETAVYIKDKKSGSTKKEMVDWSHFAEEEKKKILEKLKDKTDEKSGGFPRYPTKGEQDVIAAIDRNIAKLAFDVGFRGMYLASKDVYNGANIPGLLGVIRQYNSKDLNGLKLKNPTSFDYPWQDFKNLRLERIKRKHLRAFKLRGYFGMSGRPVNVMSTEELATMYHFPGVVASTPTFTRIMSKKAEAPSNLPL